MKFLKSLFGRNAGLSREQRMFWEEKGYIVLESVFSENRIDAFWAEVEERWQKRKDGSSPVSIDILEGEESGKRMMFADADESIRDLPYKLNDLFIVYEGCRDVCLDTQMVDQLNELIDGEVSAINSLLFERGSQQPGHVDIYYMAPPVEGKMVVSSICLEDIHADAGPLLVCPGSHKIPPFRFSDGSISNTDNSEFQSATDYNRAEFEKRGIAEVPVLAKKGDVIVWHSHLFHGGARIDDPKRTRRSLVTHYWRAEDMDPEKFNLEAHGENGYYWARDPMRP